MSEYQLEIRQLVDYPRCRIYREFVQTLIADRSIRTNGGSGLFYYTVLCSYANFRTSYRRLDSITYTIYPGEWVCRTSELAAWFRVRFQYKALSILKGLQERHLISFTPLGHGNLVKYSIKGWRKHKGIINNAKTKILLNLEDEEARRVQSILHLSEAEVMEITYFERGSGLISTNNNNVTVEIKCSQMEKELITTDRRELQVLLNRDEDTEAAG